VDQVVVVMEEVVLQNQIQITILDKLEQQILVEAAVAVEVLVVRELLY
jgi:hypothetical protein